MFETPPAVTMTAEQKRILEAWAQAPRTPKKIVLRSRICLLAAAGKPNQVIARELKTSRPTVILWRKRFEAGGSAGIAGDAPHGRSSRRTKDQVVKAIVEAKSAAAIDRALRQLQAARKNGQEQKVSDDVMGLGAVGLTYSVLATMKQIQAVDIQKRIDLNQANLSAEMEAAKTRLNQTN